MEQAILDIKTISLGKFYDLFKKHLNTNQTKLFNALNEKLGTDYDRKTYSNWKEKNTYHALYANEYLVLFELFESLCEKQHKDPKKIFMEGFSLPDACNSKSLSELKEIIVVKLDEYYDSSNRRNIREKKTFDTTELLQAINFLNECRTNRKKLSKIRISFQSGWNWLRNFEDRFMFLKSLDKLNIPIQILVNDEESAHIISASMTNPEKKDFYFSINTAIHKWNETISGLKNFEFRISNLPILRKAYIIEYTDNTVEALVRHYVYNLYMDYENANLHLSNDDLYVDLFRKEFDFLWNKSSDYNQWTITSQKPNEQLPINDYLFLYPDPKKDLSSQISIEKAFVVSSLKISKHNIVDLNLNINYSNGFHLTQGTPEFTYSGSAHVTRNNIFMTLHDTNGEHISLTFIRPARNADQIDRYIGIINKSNAQAQPTALKCACIKREYLTEKDWTNLASLFAHDSNSNQWDALSLDFDTIEKFYSKDFLE